LQRGLKAAGEGIVEERYQSRNDDDNSEAGQETDQRSEATKEALKPLEYSACIDWDVRVKSSMERRVVTGLRESRGEISKSTYSTD